MLKPQYYMFYTVMPEMYDVVLFRKKNLESFLQNKKKKKNIIVPLCWG